MSEELKKLLHEIREAINIYLSLPKRKRLKRKNWEGYIYLVRLEAVLKQGLNIETTARFVGEEPKMEVCDIVEEK